MKKDKEWLKEQINYLKEAVGKPAINDFSRGLNDAYDTLESLIDQLDEPEKVVVSKKETVEVPQFVADWIEKHKYSSDLIDLYSSIEYATDSDGFIEDKWQHSKEFYDWLSDDTDKIYLLADAMRYGYTIEKETMYYVILVESEDKEYGQALYKDFNYDGDKVVSTHIETFIKRISLEAGNFHFTEQEIKSIDERYWAFAEEVTDNA